MLDWRLGELVVGVEALPSTFSFNRLRPFLDPTPKTPPSLVLKLAMAVL